jgi:hypothetical protein
MGDGNCLQQRAGVTFVSCMATIKKSNYLAMLTKGMTALQPGPPAGSQKVGSIWALCFVERRGTMHKEQGELP